VIIAIDYDRTWSADPSTWNAVYELLLSRGHQVIMVTGRKQWTDDMKRGNLPESLRIFYTNGQLKEWSLRTQRGPKVDIWIDDMPGMIQNCKLLQGDL